MESYLKSRRSGKDTPHTHTRIGDTSMNIYPGSYAIPDSEYESFMKLYYHRVMVNHEKEYLTERQLPEDGPILVDIDLRYDSLVKTRQHETEHVIDLMDLYMRTLSDMLILPDDAQIECFCMEKPDVNCLPDKTKDGVHMVISLAMDRPAQRLLRTRVLKPIAELWSDLPITNDWEDVIDEAVTKGCANWQMYGSRKPGHQAYKLKYHYTASRKDGSWHYDSHNILDFKFDHHLCKLSARYTGNPKYELRDEVKEELNKTKPSTSSLSSKPTYTTATAMLPSFNTIQNEKQLDECLENWLEGLENDDYRLKEAHEYTMALPSKYYGPGSYTNWMQVGWALANTSPQMFLTWLKLTSQEGCRCTLRNDNSKFEWSMVGELWEKWLEFKTNDSGGLTHRSIHYWCKNDAPDEYEKIRSKTLDYYLMKAVKKPTDSGLAVVLHHMFAGRYVCVSIKGNVWYEYIGHRWHEIDSGTTLRLHISKDMHDLFFKKMVDNHALVATGTDENSPQFEKLKKDINSLTDICSYLQTTQWKNNIMREAKDLFWDRTFIERLDQNPNLLCFSNGIIDFTTKEFRPGRPEDCVSKCTNINYEPLDKARHHETIEAIELFFNQLFPEPELKLYMWEHLASVLIGTNRNQTFNIYTGSGRNGKSIMVELMARCLGTYKAQVPVGLITQSRPSIGNTSSEIVQLMGVRYAVMQEPSKGDKINEGIMKEITGGDPIQGRALFKDTVTFMPQFKLVVCTNTLFDIKSNDDGTWRRIRVCDFKSKFIETPFNDEIHFPRNEYPYQFKVNDRLKEQFDEWAPVLASMLVEKAYQTLGRVEDRPIVTASSEDYREGQDYLLEFINEKIKEEPDGKVKKMDIAQEFSDWFKINRGTRPPHLRELYDFMDSRYGKYKKGGWHNITIIFDE